MTNSASSAWAPTRIYSNNQTKHSLFTCAPRGLRWLPKSSGQISEGQAEPWETITTPPNPSNQGMYSCLPEQVINNYNNCMDWYGQETSLYAYLFWGAEYWILRKQGMDASYLQAFAQILEHADK